MWPRALTCWVWRADGGGPSGARGRRGEGRAVLHTALRAPRGQGPFSDEVHAVLDAMLDFVDGVWATDGGPNPGDIHDVVNIGIGGSDLGPQMVGIDRKSTR